MTAPSVSVSTGDRLICRKPSRRSQALAAIFTALIIAGMAWWAGPVRLIEVAKSFGWWGGLKLFWLVVLATFLRSLRLYIALPAADRPARARMIAITSMHQFLNHFLPARLGEVSFPMLLRRYGGGRMAGASAALVQVRIQEIAVLLLLFLAALGMSGIAPIGAGALALAAGALAATAVLARKLVVPMGAIGQRWAERAAKLPMMPIRMRTVLPGFWASFVGALATPPAFGLRIFGAALTTGIWLTTFTLFRSVFRLTGFEIDLARTIVGSTAANFTQLLPLNTLGSFGSLEAGWTAGFVWVGVPSQEALATGLVMHIFVVGSLALLALSSAIVIRPVSAADAEAASATVPTNPPAASSA